MSLDAWLRDHPDAGEDELREVLAGHLCRCTGYAPIVKAALAAAAALREELGCLISAPVSWRA